jgi:uncharacterized oligopeptide transporter (OPT) family protein
MRFQPSTSGEQIIKEKLAFPSGTATAQLISVLHRLPPPSDATVRKRAGYTTLDTDEPVISGQVEEEETQEPIAPSEGWGALSWSFLASGLMTVRTFCSHL